MKSPYTKFRRLQIYRIMLKKIKSKTPVTEPLTYDNWFTHSGKAVNFCLLLCSFGQGFDIGEFPELASRQPLVLLRFNYWFHPYDRTPRIIILEEIIEEMNVSFFNIILFRH